MIPYHAVIFDMDGLMFDTETIAYDAWKKAGQTLGFSMTDDVFNLLKGRTEVGIMEEMATSYPGQPVDLWRTEMLLEKQKIVAALTEAPAKEGLYDLVNFLQDNQIKMAVASSSPPAAIAHYLTLSGLTPLFSAVVSGEEVANGKPAPDIFCKAGEKLGFAPADCLVLEDSFAGILAAKAAGCHGFLVPDGGYLTPEMTKTADRVFESLEKVRQFLAK